MSQEQHQYDYLIYIGRFQPYHLGHELVVKEALRLAREVIILIGSSNQPRTPKNPWTFVERSTMILNAIPEEYAKRKIHFRPLRDRPYNEEQWNGDVQEAVYKITCDNPKAKIGLIGYTKDDSSYYLKNFPQWDYVEANVNESINATDLRLAYFKHDFMSGAKLYLNENVIEQLKQFKKTPEYDLLVEEQHFLDEHARKWAFAPYPVTFNTADAVVVQSGHILLIQRKNAPGKGLWALPGGYLDKKDNTLEDCAIRELTEETCIKLQEIVLRRSIKAKEEFAHKNRSLRGRIITMAFLIQLEQIGKGLPKVKPKDDALKVRWFPISQVRNMEHVMFEDHYSIIEKMISKL